MEVHRRIITPKNKFTGSKSPSNEIKVAQLWPSWLFDMLTSIVLIDNMHSKYTNCAATLSLRALSKLSLDIIEKFLLLNFYS